MMSTKEGSLGAPTRHVIDWSNPDFTDEKKLDDELRRVFDICHGCRRCFNLCESFPNLFDMIDESKTGELDGVASSDFGKVVDACTMCDMCFLTKCPYVPPHEFNLDFPHLMLRYRYAKRQKNKHSWQASNENRQKEANRTSRDRIKDFTHPSTILSLTRTQSERIAAHSPAVVSSNRITIGTSSIGNFHRRGRTDLCSTYSSHWSSSFVPVMPRCLFQISK